MSIQEDDNREKFINVEFPYNDDILKSIREKRDKFLSANWDGDSKSWKFSLDERSLIFLSEIRTKFSFDIDDELENYFLRIKNIISNIENYVPMVVIADTKLEFKNIPLKFPEKIEKSITDAIFYARKMGVYTWDEEIQQVLTANFSKSGIAEFLNTDPGQRFFWDTEKYQEKDAYELIKYLKPCLFIVPVDKELEISQKIIENIRQIGILNEETSVMFRLPSETGSNFNEFVKTERLNNPITDKTKAVLVSGKIPKTILMKNIKFHCIFNYNIYNVHYTVQEFVKFHENVIHFTPKKEQQDILW